ncbi:14902_t:CDS:2, partial [Acaulospora morrowiae]
QIELLDSLQQYLIGQGLLEEGKVSYADEDLHGTKNNGLS